MFESINGTWPACIHCVCINIVYFYFGGDLFVLKTFRWGEDVFAKQGHFWPDLISSGGFLRLGLRNIAKSKAFVLFARLKSHSTSRPLLKSYRFYDGFFMITFTALNGPGYTSDMPLPHELKCSLRWSSEALFEKHPLLLMVTGLIRL